jgi:HSP20 family molecular chaperone IbpA
VLHRVRPVTIEPRDGGHLLRVALPFATKDDLELHRRGGDLHLKVAGVRRTVPLPATLRRSEIAGAGLRDGWLEVRFDVAGRPAAPAAPAESAADDDGPWLSDAAGAWS